MIKAKHLSVFFTGLSKYLQNCIQLLYNFSTFKRRLFEIINVSHCSCDRKRIPDYKNTLCRVRLVASAHKVHPYGHS
jgi:hypothetical protein